MQVELITIGDELLIGQVINTNAAWLGKELNNIGAELMRVTTVRDRKTEMLSAIESAFSRVDVLLLTGGLGPTKDDITKTVLCDYFQTRLRFDESVLQNIESIYVRKGRPITESTRLQAMVPEACEVIQNLLGSAPVMWFEQNGKILVSMPGVPYEMIGTMQRDILPRLEARFADGAVIAHAVCWVKNFGESALSEHLDAFEKSLPASIKLAYLPSDGVVRLRLTGRGFDGALLERQMQAASAELDRLLGDHIFSHADKSVSAIVGEELLKRGLTLGVAESCTGGGLARMLVENPGSSAYFKGGIVAYDNEVKVNLLGVSSETLAFQGAVCADVVRQMTEGIQRQLQVDCAIATSGIAGPTGGSLEKPVGTVWISVRCGDRSVERCYLFGKIRTVNMTRASQAGALLLLELLSENTPD